MAGEGYLVERTALAAADLSTKQYLFVDLNSSDQVAVVATAGTDYYGVLQNDPDALGKAAIVAISGQTKVIAGSTLAVGDEVSISSAAKAVPATGGMSVGICRRAASTGNVAIIDLYRVPRLVQPLFLGVPNVEVITGTKTLLNSSPTFQKLSAASGQNVVLPVEATSVGRVFLVFSSGASTLTVKASDGSTTVGAVTTGTSAWFACDGTTWVRVSSIV